MVFLCFFFDVDLLFVHGTIRLGVIHLENIFYTKVVDWSQSGLQDDVFTVVPEDDWHNLCQQWEMNPAKGILSRVDTGVGIINISDNDNVPVLRTIPEVYFYRTILLYSVCEASSISTCIFIL